MTQFCVVIATEGAISKGVWFCLDPLFNCRYLFTLVCCALTISSFCVYIFNQALWPWMDVTLTRVPTMAQALQVTLHSWKFSWLWRYGNRAFLQALLSSVPLDFFFPFPRRRGSRIWHWFWYPLCQGSKQVEPMLKLTSTNCRPLIAQTVIPFFFCSNSFTSKQGMFPANNKSEAIVLVTPRSLNIQLQISHHLHPG